MKKYILMPVLAALSLSGSVIQAQDFDNNPVELHDWCAFHDGRCILSFGLHSGKIGSSHY